MKSRIVLLLSAATFSITPLLAMDDDKGSQTPVKQSQGPQLTLDQLISLVNEGQETKSPPLQPIIEEQEIKDSLFKIINHNFQKRNPHLPKSSEGIGLSLDLDDQNMGGGFLYFHNDSKGQQFSCFTEVYRAKVPRDRTTLEAYFEQDPNGKKVLMVGSGILQETIQPTIDQELKNPFFMDASSVLYPDICDRFDKEFAKTVMGKFDTVYLDSLGMHEIDDLFAATFDVLKEGGKIQLPFHIDGLSFTGEELNSKDEVVTAPHGTPERKNQYIEFVKPIVFKRLEDSGFINPKFSESSKVIRKYGQSFQHFYADKPKSR